MQWGEAFRWRKGGVVLGTQGGFWGHATVWLFGTQNLFFCVRLCFLGARRAAETLELRIFDAEERGWNQRVGGLRREGEKEETKAESVLSAHRKAMLRAHPNVADGNSAVSAPSVVYYIQVPKNLWAPAAASCFVFTDQT